MMNIKTIVIRTAKRLKRLALAICGVDALLPSPAATKRGKTATIASLRVADADAPPTDGINVVTESPLMPTTGRRRRKRYSSEVQVIPLQERRWLTIRETSARFPCFSEKALRHLVAQAEAYANYPKAGLRSNGLIASIVRPAGPRRILIDATKFEAWLASGAVASGNPKPAMPSSKAVREAS